MLFQPNIPFRAIISPISDMNSWPPPLNMIGENCSTLGEYNLNKIISILDFINFQFCYLHRQDNILPSIFSKSSTFSIQIALNRILNPEEILWVFKYEMALNILFHLGIIALLKNIYIYMFFVLFNEPNILEGPWKIFFF